MAYRALIPLQRSQILVPVPLLTKRLTTKIMSCSAGISLLASQTLTSNYKNHSLRTITSPQLVLFSQRRGFVDRTVVQVTQNIDTVQRDLLSLINTELQELQNDDFDTQEFLSKTKFQLEEKGENIQLSKISDNSTVDLTFKIPTDEDEEQDISDDTFRKTLEEEEAEKELMEKEDKEDKDKEKEEEEEEETPQIDKLKDFKVVITRQNSQGQLHAECAIGNDRRLYIEAIRFSEQSRRLFLEDLSDELVQKLYDYFHHLGIDDNTCAFIINYCDTSKLKTVTENLELLKSFVKVEK